ncbi:arsenic transporter [Formicincola oecophyllae]|uniref:Arsenical pump membrane protein n=1 Tax=Formicincola oecophyllae TaxID=2558361 RepID=A0A4Y6U6T4_9PROT|nr:arsenic transporter [Formicincola oecophyllae]QDH12864.1 arsenic transporter [Formicincola oecophyllae]
MLALVLFIITLALVITQPRGLGIGWSALGGAVAALLCGVITLQDIPVVWHIVWDATFTFVALIIISLILDEAGFFQWCALHVARWGRGRGALLFPLVVLMGAAMAALFANDGAALLLTPIVMALSERLRLQRAAALAFIMATGFVADTTSLPLVISNLVNIVSAGFFNVPFGAYAAAMVPVDMVALGATMGVLWLCWRKHIPATYRLAHLPSPASAMRDEGVFKAAFPLLGLVLTAYFITAPFHVPVCVVSGLAALALTLVAWRGGKVPVRLLLAKAPWQIVLFSLGMYLVVYGLRNAGLTGELATLLAWLGQHGALAATMGTGFLAAVMSSLMNNMPSTLVGALAIQQTPGLSAPVHDMMVYANVIGCDLGPKFTPVGSLATLLWLHVLASRDVRISWWDYMKAGFVMTPPVLAAALLALRWWVPLVR